MYRGEELKMIASMMLALMSVYLLLNLKVSIVLVLLVANLLLMNRMRNIKFMFLASRFAHSIPFVAIMIMNRDLISLIAVSMASSLFLAYSPIGMLLKNKRHILITTNILMTGVLITVIIVTVQYGWILEKAMFGVILTSGGLFLRNIREMKRHALRTRKKHE